MVLVLYCDMILIKLYTNVNCDNISDELAFQPCRCKIKVTVAYGGAFIVLKQILWHFFLIKKRLKYTKHLTQQLDI